MDRDLNQEFEPEGYSGDTNDQGEREGRGILITSKYKYEGEWKNNMKHGEGEIREKSGRVYKGEWKRDMRNGRGKQIEKIFHGFFVEIYEGEFKDDVKSGKGVQQMKNGLRYEGSFDDGKFNGEGKLEDQHNKYEYKGWFKDGRKEGKGEERYEDGSSYDGMYYNGYKHGKGVYTNKTGYSYTGDWYYGVKQGYGIELNSYAISSEDKIMKIDTLQAYKYVYEGEFWNNERHGMGKLILQTGDICYGNWIYGKRQGICLDIPRGANNYLSVYQDDKSIMKKKEKLEKNEQDFWCGYHYQIEKFFIRGGSSKYSEEDPNLRKADQLFSMNPNRISSKENEPFTAKFLRLTDIYPVFVFQPLSIQDHEKGKAYPNEIPIEKSKVHDQQLLTVLMVILRNPKDLIHILSPLTDLYKAFIMFNMYFNIDNYVQKYRVLVDDYVPVTIDGVNLFTQFEKGYNIILPLLEKSWNKYVSLADITKELEGERYVDRVLLAYLGAPCIKLKTTHAEFIESFRKVWVKGSYTFFYPRPKSLNESMVVEDYIPFHIFDFIESGNTFVFIIQLYYASQSSPQGYMSDNDRNGLEEYKDDKVSGNDTILRFYTSDNFISLFDEGYICTYKDDQKARYYTSTIPISSLETVKFHEIFFSFKANINDIASITFIQNHYFYPPADKRDISDDTKDNKISNKLRTSQDKANNPPIRIVLGRKRTFNDLKLKKKEYNIEEVQKNEKDILEQNQMIMTETRNLKEGLDNKPAKQKRLDNNNQEIDSDDDSSMEEERGLRLSKLKSSNQNGQTNNDKNVESLKDVLNIDTVPNDSKIKDEENGERDQFKKLFEKMEKDYRNDIKYVSGAGQTKSQILHLK